MFEIDVTYEVDGFSLDVAIETSTGRFAVTGPSGSGKTTVLRVVAGLVRQAEGRITVGNRVLQDRDGTWIPPWERRVGWLPQDALVFPHLDARGNLEYAEPPESDVLEVVDALELEDRLGATAKTLSGGECQRVALGRALLSEPDVLLLDEPFSALDDDLTERVVDFLDTWCRDRECAMLVAAHDEKTVEPLVDDGLVLHDGYIAEQI